MVNISMDVMTVTMNMMKFFNEKRPPGSRNAEAGKSIGLPRTISNRNQKTHFNELLADNNNIPRLLIDPIEVEIDGTMYWEEREIV